MRISAFLVPSCIAAVATAGAGGAAAGVGFRHATDSAAGAARGVTAPALRATTLDGRPFHWRRAAGKVTILNFWATWCPPCRAETPDLIAAYGALHARGVDFLGIDTTESAPIVKTFVSAKGVPFATVLGGPETYNSYGIAYIPTTVVLDPDGIVRARFTGGVTPQQLTAYVRDAFARRSSPYVSPVQRRIDALLAPRRYRFDGTPADRDGAVRAMNAALARSDTLARQNEGSVDYERTTAAQGALRIAAAEALRKYARTTPQKVAALELRARGEGNRNRWPEAAQSYRDALALSPDAPRLVAGLSHAYYRLHEYDAMIAQALRYTHLAPADGDGWSELGLAYQRARRFERATGAYAGALELLQRSARKKPTQDALADVADTALDAANVYVSLGDVVAARKDFALANAYAERLQAKGDYVTLKRNVKERTQEGMVAVAVARGGARPVVSVAAWTGPDLPGSLAATLKYRLIVAAPAARSVTLQARGLRRAWVASFCADGLCSPRSVSFESPASGVKTYEFQLVPPHDGAQPGKIAIAVSGGGVVPVPAIVRARR